MKASRVECDQCINFIDPVFEFENPDEVIVSKTISNAKCKLGKRVMFRMQIPELCHIDLNKMGYFRYCNEFKTK